MPAKNQGQARWAPEQVKAFEDLKLAISDNTTLQSPDPMKTCVPSTDTDTTRIGAVMSQADNSGVEKPVTLYSQVLRLYQKHYSVTELELLALVKAIEHFAICLIGKTLPSSSTLAVE